MGYVTGKIIKELRERRKITQRELSETIGVSDKTVSKWETEKGFPDIGIIEELAKALGVSIAELLTGISSRLWDTVLFHAAESLCRKQKLKKAMETMASVWKRWIMNTP